MAEPRHLLICGLGYAGKAVARRAVAEGWRVSGTARDPVAWAGDTPPAVAVIGFDRAGEVLANATHLLVTAAPGDAGDPVLLAHRDAILVAPHLVWIGYLSTTGVYGDRGGGWVDEDTPPAPGQDRSRRRVAAEQAWRDLAGAAGRALDVFRVGGIYGPGRSAIDDLRAGTLRQRVIKPGHAFGRIHRDDIALAVLAAASQEAEGPRRRVFNLVDDEPAESAVVVAEAARLLGVTPPPALPFEEAAPTMSPMARSFWAENRRVSNAQTKSALRITWHYPTFREGLRAILDAQSAPAREEG